MLAEAEFKIAKHDKPHTNKHIPLTSSKILSADKYPGRTCHVESTHSSPSTIPAVKNLWGSVGGQRKNNQERALSRVAAATRGRGQVRVGLPAIVPLSLTTHSLTAAGRHPEAPRTRWGHLHKPRWRYTDWPERFVSNLKLDLLIPADASESRPREWASYEP